MKTQDTIRTILNDLLSDTKSASRTLSNLENLATVCVAELYEKEGVSPYTRDLGMTVVRRCVDVLEEMTAIMESRIIATEKGTLRWSIDALIAALEAEEVKHEGL